MAAPIAQEKWLAVRASARQAGDRFAELACSAPDPMTRATADWSVAETAAHVAAVTWLDTTLLGGNLEPVPIPGLAGRLPVMTVDGIHAFNNLTLRHFTERDPETLAGLMLDRIGRMLDSTEGRDPAETVAWIGGSRLPLAGLFAHLVNELLLHGDDIARAIRARWAIPPRDAAQFFELFMVGLVQNDLGRLLDGGGPPRERRIAVEFRSAHTTPVTLVLQRGRLSAERPGRDTDVRMSFDPVTFNLMMFGRVSRLRAGLTRKIVVSGRRPWLLPAFLRVVRCPT